MSENTKKLIVSNVVKLCFTIAIFGLMIFGFYYNQKDGIWNGTYYYGDNWELSLGRWAIRYLDKIFFGIHVHPYSSIITLAFFVLGTCFIMKTFDIPIGSVTDYVVSFMFLGNVVVCVSISYLYTSLVYGLSFCLVGVSFLLITYVAGEMSNIGKGKIVGLILIVFVAVSLILGLYQAYIGCLAELLVFYFVYMIYKEYDKKEIGKCVLISSVSAFGGAIMYYIILHIELVRHQTAMSSYKGADSFSVTNILTNLWSSVKMAYLIMFRYINGKLCHWNMISSIYVWLIILVIAVSFAVASYRRTKSLIRTTLGAVIICLSPIAICITTILIPNNVPSIQETAPLALAVPGVVALFSGVVGCENKEDRVCTITKIAVMIVSVCIIHGSIFQVLADQDTMRKGTLSAESISKSVMDKLIADGENIEENTYAIIGSPAKSPLVENGPLYDFSNAYARIQGPYNGLDSWTWRGIFENVDGLHLEMCDDDTYLKILQDEETNKMPNFPAEGSILTHSSGVRVVKISEW